jgi:hypothetical protein
MILAESNGSLSKTGAQKNTGTSTACPSANSVSVLCALYERTMTVQFWFGLDET